MNFKSIIDVLNRRGFNAKAFKDIEQVKKVLLEEIDEKQSVGIGGSVTVKESGISDLLRQRGNQVYFHWETVPEERKQTCQKALHADVYIASSNAVTMDGKLVNIDGTGNRVAGMFYGPEKVYIICGRNKIADNEQEAVKRIKTIACPKNAERLNRNTPCRKTGECADCLGDSRMCNVRVVIECPTAGREINVFIVDQDLGY